MQCPRCQKTLHMTERQGVEIDYCPECRGVWLDRGELDKIIERAGPADARGVGAQEARSSASRYPRQSSYKAQPVYEERSGQPQRPYYSEHQPHRPAPYGYRQKKKKNMLSEIFDIFD